MDFYCLSVTHSLALPSFVILQRCHCRRFDCCSSLLFLFNGSLLLFLSNSSSSSEFLVVNWICESPTTPTPGPVRLEPLFSPLFLVLFVCLEDDDASRGKFSDNGKGWVWPIWSSLFKLLNQNSHSLDFKLLTRCCWCCCCCRWCCCWWWGYRQAA